MHAWTPARLGGGAFALACLVLVLIGWLAFHRMAELRKAHDSVDRTRVVVDATDVLLSLLKDAETGQRGFVITGDARYLAPYETAVNAVDRHVEELRRLTAATLPQHARLASLEELIRQKLDELRATIVAREHEGFDAAARIVATGYGKEVMDGIRDVVAGMREEEDRLLDERQVVVERKAWVATIANFGGLGVALGLIVAAGLFLNRAVRARERERAVRVTTEALAVATAESEAWLRVILASIGDAVIATDEHARVKLMNPVAESLTGWSEVDARGHALAEVFVIVDEHSGRPVANPADTVLRERTIAGLAGHTVLVAKDGREVAIDDSAAPIMTPGAALLGVVLVFRDISARRGLERERAGLLENEQNASRAKDVFLALVSHELRTPLTAVLGWLRMLRSGLLDPSTTARALEVIERNTRQQSRLVDDLLDVSRIVTGRVALDLGPVHVPTLVEMAIDSIRPSAEARGIRLTSEVDATIGSLHGDPARLQQVVGNLLANAVKFTSPGGHVDARLVCTHDRLRLTVRDTGRGIDPALLPYVFEPFRQATDARGHGNRGLGLGLAIVRHLVELHGGTVTAHSEGPGTGATFIVELRAPAAPHDAEASGVKRHGHQGGIARRPSEEYRAAAPSSATPSRQT